jgi:acetyl esterase/lipase
MSLGLSVVLLLASSCAISRPPSVLPVAKAYAVQVVTDIDYVPDQEYADDRDKLDLYLPDGRRDCPVLLWLHGGALTGGDKEEGAHVAYYFARAGIATVVSNYRLSPDFAHPAHVQDVATAVAWIRSRIPEYGGNPNAIFVAGHSAGAYLTALVSLDDRYLAERQLRLNAIKGAIPVSGYFYVERVAPHRDKSVWGEDPAKWPDASPARYVRPDAPPMLLLSADGDEDWRRAQTKEMAAALKNAGHSDINLLEIRDRDHATIGSQIGEGDEVARLIVDFVMRRARPSQR